MDKIKFSLYCDGGVIGSNPSPIGGTWAWRTVAGDEVIKSDSGVITPEGAGMMAISNNLTEMLAVLNGLQDLPAGFAGTIYSDSQVTLGRLFQGWKWNNIPQWMHLIFQTQIKRLVFWGEIRHVLLAGHPTRAQLAAGVGHSGLPVSEHNVACDRACSAEARMMILESAKVGE